MRRLFSFTLCGALLVLAGCGRRQADVIFTNASIWTGVRGASRAEAMAIRDGKIIAVGEARRVGRFNGSGTEVVDLGGKFVVPGLMDSHVHLMSGGFQLLATDLRNAASREEFVARVAAAAKEKKEGEWVLGGDWDHENWGGGLPHRIWIDGLTEDVPVFLTRVDGHMALANSRALELAGITRESVDPPGGVIVRDAWSGEPTGILKDEAMAAVQNVVPPPTEEQEDAALARAMDHAASLGITSVHDMGTWRDLETYARARDLANLTVRIYSVIWYTDWEKVAARLREKGSGDEWLWWGGVKAMIDGSLGSSTAWMHEPYLGEETNRGLIIPADTAEFKGVLQEADRSGIQLAVHAIGTRANEWILDQFDGIADANGRRDRRFRIEHAQHLAPNLVARFAPADVIASVQPYHCIDDSRWAHKRVAPSVLQNTYPFRSLRSAGATLAFGSDWTVAPLNPLLGICAAVTRRTLDGSHPDGWYPEEKVSVEEALRAYTMGVAYAGFQEDRLGTLEVGKLADLVVLSDDIMAIDPAKIQDAKVVRTVVGGRTVFAASD